MTEWKFFFLICDKDDFDELAETGQGHVSWSCPVISVVFAQPTKENGGDTVTARGVN